MTRICPNCNYTRKATDDAPEWQCPACEKAYNKGSGSRVDENYGRYGSVKRPSSSGGVLLKWVLVVVIAGAGVWSMRPFGSEKALSGVVSAQRGEQPEVLMYATEWCGYCAAAREFFSANGIRYSELDIEKSSAGYDGHRKLGGNGVPLIVVGSEVVHGFDEGQLRSLLKPWMKRS